MNTSGSEPVLATRCAVPTGTSIADPGETGRTSPSSVTTPSPLTTNQCSARFAWRW